MMRPGEGSGAKAAASRKRPGAPLPVRRRTPIRPVRVVEVYGIASECASGKALCA